MIRIALLLTAVVTGCSSAPKEPQTAKTEVPPQTEQVQKPTETQGNISNQADKWLRRLSDTMKSLKSFTVTSASTIEVVTNAGQKLQFDATSDIAVRRPNGLRSDRHGEIADTSLIYDGNKVTVFGKNTGYYAVADAPNRIDQMTDFVMERLNIYIPIADLLQTNVYETLKEGTISGEYVGKTMVHDKSCHHLAFRKQDVDWQIWIQDGEKALPCKYVVTSKDIEGSPEYVVVLSGWELNPKLRSDMFTFSPPKNSEQIDFLEASKDQQKPLEATN